MRRKILKFIKKKFPIVMVAVMLASFLPYAPVDAEGEGESQNSPITESNNQVVNQQQVAETEAATPLSWSALSLLDKNVMTTLYQSDRPNAKLSADERYVAINRHQLLSVDPPQIKEVITVYDRVTGEMDNISVPGMGGILDGTVLDFDMSDDANYIAFSYSVRITEEMNVYFYDRQNETLELVTPIAGDDIYGDDANRVSISADGRYVAFDSDAKGLVSEDQDSFRDVFVYDRLAAGEKIKRISTLAGLTADDVGHSSAPSISGDGRFIAFQSRVNLTKDENDTSDEDIYIYDKNNADTPFKEVSVGLGGVNADGMSMQPSISADGQAVAFLSEATNLVNVQDENYDADLFVSDGLTVKRVAFVPEVVDPADLDKIEIKKPSISPDGKYVGYERHDDTATDTIIDSYVASVDSATSTQVTVPNTPIKLVNQSHSTVVGAGAKTVVFYSQYEKMLAGNIKIDAFGPFIASQGSVPVWAPGSTLQATEQAGTITLTWPDATDAGEILGYQIYQNDSVVGYVPFSEDNSFTATGLNPAQVYQFQVEAVNSGYNVSFGGPTHISGSQTPVDQLVVYWGADRTKNQLPMIGSTATFYAISKTGLHGEGNLSYKVVTAGGNTESRTETLTLTERSDQPGYYTATFPITEGMVELTSLVVKMTDPTTQVMKEQTLVGWPLKVSGNMTFQFENPGQANLEGTYLSVRSNRIGGETIALNGQDPVTIEGLHPDEDYTATLYSAGSMRVLAQKVGLRVGAGQKTNTTLQVIAPANLRFQMVDTEGKPVENIGVQLFDSKQEYLGSYTTNDEGWTGFLSHLIAGDQITAKIDIGDYMFQQVPIQKITLGSGDNEKKIALSPLPVGVLEGIVTNADNEPVLNAIVTMQQIVDGKSIVRRAYSSLSGHYKFDGVFAGDVSVEALEVSNKYKTEQSLTAKIEAEKTTVLPITVSQPKTGIINLKVYLKYIDNEWMGPVDLSQMPFAVRIEYQGGGWQSGYYQNAYDYHGYPNRNINVCVTAITPSYTHQCVGVMVDANGNATAELRFEEIGGRIQGSLDLADDFSVYGNLYKVSGNSETWAQHIGSQEFRGNDFNINIMEPGRYRLDLVHTLVTDRYRYEYATVEFTVEDQKITQLGTIDFSSTSYFTNMPGNVFTAIPSEVFPGGKVGFRVAYQNIKDKEATDTSLVVSIPDGLSPIKDTSGRIIVNGVQTEATLDGKNLLIPLGDLEPNKSGTVSYQLKADPSFDGFNVRTAARIKTTIDGKAVNETIGTILLDTPKVTVEVKERLSSLQTEISGYAPAGSTVKLYDGDELVGNAIASPTGLWRANALLADLGDPSTHALYAEASTVNSVTLRSKTVYTEYNTVSPKLLEMAMAQAPDGKWAYLQVEKGITRLPYTVVPGHPFQFELKFDRPDDVYNVYVYLGGQTGKAVKAVRDGNIYRAVTPTGLDALGGIYVSYDEKPAPFTPANHTPTLEEIRQSMPPDMRDFEVVSTTPFELKNGKYSGQVKVKFPQLDDIMMTVTLSIEPNASYQPSAAEIALAEQSGLPMLDSSISETETEESLKTVLEGYVPMDVLFPNGLPGTVSSASSSVKMAAGGLSGWGAVGHLTTEATMEFTDVIKTGNDIRKSFNDQKDFASRINKIMYNVESGFDCLAEVPTTVNEAGKALVAVVGGEFSKVALGAWAGAMGLTGAPGVAAAAAVYVAEQKIDAYVDSKIDAIGSGYNECREDNEKKKRRKVAEPKWIYDPSGYVYEAVPENRLEGVKATVLYLDPETKTWVVWDAGPYEQINPHDTNSEGKYGWDVPPGKWKVVWEKEGYETQTSAELEVPPPHTDVNAGLISRAAPQVEKVTGVRAATGSYVDVTFTKYLKVSELPTNALTVVDPDGKNVAGIAKFIDAVDNPVLAGSKLTRTVRFEVTGALDLTKQYQMKVNPSFFQSYADVWMKEAYNRNFTVMEEDVTGPTAMVATANGMLLTIEYNELLHPSADVEKFLVNGEAGMISSAVTDVNNHKLLYLSLKQQLPANRPIEITALAGAIKDELGNPSVESKLNATNQSASTNALLSGLSLDAGILSPSFDPSVLSYTVEVANSVSHLQITANAADSKAKVFINGIESANGVVKTVLIPENGEISITVIAEDGTSRVYSIQVNRVVSTDATLSGLSVNPGTLAPFFNSNTGAYNVTVARGVTEIQVTATAKDARSTITVNGGVALSGTAKTVTIPADRKINVTVTAEDGTTTRTYTITIAVAITEEPEVSKDATLSALSVNPGTLTPVFKSNIEAYEITLGEGEKELNISAVANDAKSTITINGEVVTICCSKRVVIPADEKINIVVTAEDGYTKKTYKIQVNRQPNNDHAGGGSGGGTRPTLSDR